MVENIVLAEIVLKDETAIKTEVVHQNVWDLGKLKPVPVLFTLMTCLCYLNARIRRTEF